MDKKRKQILCEIFTNSYNCAYNMYKHKDATAHTFKGRLHTGSIFGAGHLHGPYSACSKKKPQKHTWTCSKHICNNETHVYAELYL